MNTLKAENIQFTIRHQQILSDIFLQLNTGDITGLLGRNGSGKTTLLKIIFGSLRSPSQVFHLNGRHYDSFSGKKIIAYYPQASCLPRTFKVKQVIRFFHNQKEIIRQIEADSRVREFLDRKVASLSAGQRRYLELLLFIHLDCPFLFLDEPFARVEPLYKTIIKTVIKKEAAAKGIIITDHDYRNVVDLSTGICVLAGGHLKQLQDNEDIARSGYLPDTIDN